MASRSENAIKNIRTSITGEGIRIILGFTTRYIFLYTIGTQYLGLNQIFASLVGMLSLVDLGVGSAIIHKLYKPIAEGNKEEISALMNFYKWVYRLIGIIILILGIMLTPFISFFFKDDVSFVNIYLIFFLYLLKSVSSYFFSAYKSALIGANQKKHILSKIEYIFNIISNILQVFILLVTENFVLYTATFIFITILRNLYVAKICDKMYPFLKDYKHIKISKETKTRILKDSYALLIVRVSNSLINFIDNFVLSKFVGLIAVGVYSNYTLITLHLKTLLRLSIESLTAIIGNIAVSETKEKLHNYFNLITYFSFLFFGVISVSFYVNANIFIEAWLGKQFLLDQFVVFLMLIDLILFGLRVPIMTFRNSLGLFTHYKYRSLIACLIKLVAALILIKTIGIGGIVVASIVANLFTYNWIDPVIVCDRGLGISPKTYFLKSIYFILVTLVAAFISVYAVSFVEFDGFVQFFICGLMTVSISSVVMILLTCKMKELKLLTNIIVRKVLKNG